MLVEARAHPPEVSLANLAHRGMPGLGRTRAGLQALGGDSVAARHLLRVGQMRAEGVLTVILPKDRDPRFITIRRGGTLSDSDHQLLALWAALCAEHVLDLFESVKPSDSRPRHAIEQARAWARGEIRMSQARTAAGHAMGAARELSRAARHAAYAAGQAAAGAPVAAHELCAA